MEGRNIFCVELPIGIGFEGDIRLAEELREANAHIHRRRAVAAKQSQPHILADCEIDDGMGFIVLRICIPELTRQGFYALDRKSVV